jgi:hypothetical protein
MATILYTGPIILTQDTEIKFFSIDEDGNVEPLQTRQYTIDLNSASLSIPTVLGNNRAVYAPNLITVEAEVSGVQSGYLNISSVDSLQTIEQINISGNVIISDGLIYISTIQSLITVNAVKIIGTNGVITLVNGTLSPSTVRSQQTIVSLDVTGKVSGLFLPSTVLSTPRLVSPPTLEGMKIINAIRAPDGKPLDLRRITGEPYKFSNII